jgi:hypothetical protein
MMKARSLVLLVTLLPGCAFAQARPDSIHARNDCRLAVQVVETGHPAPHSDWAYEYVVNCGRAGGSALASAMRRARSSSDVAELEAMTRSLRTFRDGEVFVASLEIAGDKSASVPARVLAFRSAIASESPGRTLTYEQMTRRDANGACVGLGGTPHDDITEGAPLPLGHTDRLIELAENVIGDNNEPAQVRQAARCALRQARIR